MADCIETSMTAGMVDLEELDQNLYRATNLWRPLGARGVYGGQIMGQCLVAATRTVKDPLMSLHSMHSYFVRAGMPDIPVIYRVTIVRDGSSFSTRVVTASQNGKAILTLQASYHKESGEVGRNLLNFQQPMPEVKHHTELMSMNELYDTILDSIPSHLQPYLTERQRDSANIRVEIKPADPYIWARKKASSERKTYYWAKSKGHVGDNANLHKSLAAYISDWSLLWTALHSDIHLKVEMVASLDHSIWFHHQFKVDEWMLYVVESSVSCNNRAFVHGRLYTEDGTLAASVAQEANCPHGVTKELYVRSIQLYFMQLHGLTPIPIFSKSL